MSLKMTLDVQKITRLFLPRVKRQENRISVLNCFLKPIETVFKEFTEWKKYIRSFRITSQVGVLQEYLGRLFDTQVNIETSFEGGVLVSKNRAEGHYKIDEMADVPLKGEMQEYFKSCDYVVHISNSVPLELVKKEIERFRRAGKKVIIKQN